jgi:hypothetical protein
MFFIMGISSKEKKLDFNQMTVCSCCGKYGHIEVFMTYMYFSLFFLPLFKWSRRYYVRMTCCGAECEIDSTLGKAIASGEVKELRPENLHFTSSWTGEKRCSFCGYTTTEDFKYCPKCGREL